jgi:cellulose biosynthesis protein BcsQ
VIIADTDIEYSRALAKALAVKETEFTVVFDFDLLSSDSDQFSKRAIEEDTLLLVNSEIKEELIGSCNDSSQIIGMLPFGREGINRTGFINKYKGLAGILEDLWLLSGRNSEREECIPCNSPSRLIGVTGGAGGSGKTSIAIALGRELCLLNDTTALYVSFENATATEQYFPPFGGEKSLNDLLYYLHTENLSHIADRMNAFLIKDAFGLETFRSSDNINELATAQVELVRKFMEQVFLWNEFEYIVLDFQLEASKRCHWLLSSCDYVLVVDDGPYTEARKTQLLLDHWRQRTGSDSEKTLLFIHNKWEGDDEETGTNEKEHLSIEYDPESFHRYGDRIEIEMDRRFGMGVKKIATTIRKGT